MRKAIGMKTPALAALAAILMTGVGASGASARRALAVGQSAFPSYTPCFNFDYFSGTAGVGFLPGPSCPNGYLPPAWVIPIALDSTGAKTVSLTVKQTTSSQLQCLALEYNPSGTIVQLVSYGAFPVGGYATVAKSLTVATGDSLSVVCGFNSQDSRIGDARVLSVDY